MNDEKRAYNEVFGYFKLGTMEQEEQAYTMERLIKTIDAAEKLEINIIYEHRTVHDNVRESILVLPSDKHENTIDIKTNMVCTSFSVDYLENRIHLIKRQMEIQEKNRGLETRLLEEMQ